MTSIDSQSEPKISVVINTLNEERNLRYCLRSVVPWANDIVVVDMHSEDGTRAVAEEFGARVFLHERLGFADPARAFAVSKALNDWVLIVDADEIVPRSLSDELFRIALRNEADVAEIPRRNYMFGALIEHTGWGATDDRQARFFRKGSLTTTGQIHRFLHPEPGARIARLADAKGQSLIHFNYISMHQFIEKLNRYTSIEASQAKPESEVATPAASLRIAFNEWYYRYITKKGHRDGWRGFYLALSMAFYRIATAAKHVELRNAGGAEHIEQQYAQLAETVISEYAIAETSK